MLFNPLRQIADKFNEMQLGMIAANRVFNWYDRRPDSRYNEAPIFHGNLHFKDVHFSYIPDEEVIKGIDLNVNAGETIAIVGSTGAGKSTIINLLNRFMKLIAVPFASTTKILKTTL
jgi:ABC-type multidrug transport system fused ATPase/permease subunit